MIITMILLGVSIFFELVIFFILVGISTDLNRINLILVDIDRDLIANKIKKKYLTKTNCLDDEEEN